MAPQRLCAAEPTEPEQMYERLKEAEKHADRLLGERWNRLVRQRQWTDSSGKFKTYARYVEHDPDLQSVTLLILVNKGGTQSYKEANIPVAKLSKNDQAVVKRIAAMRAQVEEALANAPALDAGGGEAAYAEGAPFDPSQPAAETTAEVPPPPAHLAALAAIQPWRTDFAAFAGNVTALQGPSQWEIVYGPEMVALEVVYRQEQQIHQWKNADKFIAAEARAAAAVAPPGRETPAQDEAIAPGPDGEAGFAGNPPEAAATPDSAQGIPRSALFILGAKYGWARGGLGEVSWETTIQAAPAAGQPLQHDLQLPSPITLELIPDSASVAEFARLEPGERVRFIGRFERLGGFDDPPKIVLKVRPVQKAASATTSERSRALYGRELSP